MGGCEALGVLGAPCSVICIMEVDGSVAWKQQAGREQLLGLLLSRFHTNHRPMSS